jgi:undecaprenyl-diphosphatase
VTDQVSYLEAIVLGIVQGLTEFLPISSTAHLRILPAFFGWADPGAAFTAVIQLGTMAAVLVFFWRDIVRITSAWVRSLWTADLRGTLDARMGWYIALGTIPIAVFGLLFSGSIETGARDLRIIGWVLILFGVVLWAVDRVAPQTKTIDRLGLRDGLLFGLAQALALVPGVSRSGATITAGRALGYDREAAARFSFLLSIPAVVLSGVFEARKLGDAGGPPWGPTVVATVVSFVVGYAAIAWLLRWLTHHSMLVFAIYRVALGALVLALVYGGVIAAT